MDTIFRGKLCTRPVAESTSRGNTAIRFGLVNGRKAGQCVVWTHMLDEGLSIDRLLKGELEDEVTLKGFWGKREGKRGRKQAGLFGEEVSEPEGSASEVEFVTKWFHFSKDKPAQRNFKERVAELVSEEQARSYHTNMGKLGFVRVTNPEGLSCYAPKKDCVRHHGAWKRKIDYVLDILGPRIVKDELGMFSVRESGGRGLRPALGNNWVTEYREKLEELVETARNFEAHPPVITP